MSRAYNLIFTYDFDDITLLQEIARDNPELGLPTTIEYGTLDRPTEPTAYIIENLSYAQYLIATDYVGFTYGSLYYSAEGQFHW